MQENQKLKRIIANDEEKVSSARDIQVAFNQLKEELLEAKNALEDKASTIQSLESEISTLRYQVKEISENNDSALKDLKEEYESNLEFQLRSKDVQIQNLVEQQEIELQTKSLELIQLRDNLAEVKADYEKKLAKLEETLMSRKRENLELRGTSVVENEKLTQMTSIYTDKIRKLEEENRALKSKKIAHIPPFSSSQPSPKRFKRVTFEENCPVEIGNVGESSNKISTAETFAGIPSVTSVFLSNKSILKKKPLKSQNMSGDNNDPLLWSVRSRL